MKKALYILFLVSSFAFSQSPFVALTANNIATEGSTPPVITADYYVSSSTGNDANDGSTPELAIQSIAELQSLSSSFVAGDIIAFKRGDIWEDVRYINNDPHPSGTSGNPITFTAYGEGTTKPIIDANGPQTPTWTSEGSNVYSTPSTETRVWRNGVELLMAKDATELGQYGTGWYNASSILYVYSTTDPNVDGSTWRWAGANRNFTFYMAFGCDYIKFEDLDIRGGSTGAIRLGGTSHWEVTNCVIGKGSAHGMTGEDINYANIHDNEIDADFTVNMSLLPETGGSGDDYRGVSDGVYLQDGSSNNIIADNTFTNWGHTSFSMTGNDELNKITNNQILRNNMSCPDILYGRGIGYSGWVEYNEVAYNYIHDTATRNQLNGSYNHVHHNIIDGLIQSPIMAGYGGGEGIHIQNYNSAGPNVIGNIYENNLIMNTDGEGIIVYSIGHASGDVTDNIIRNNITYNCGLDANINNVGIAHHEDEVGQRIWNNLMQNNLSYSSASLLPYRSQYAGTRYNAADFNTNVVEASSNLDGSPDFVSSTNFHLNVNSPAVNNGNIVLSTEDYDGVSIPYSTTRNDIGVYESSHLTAPTTPDPELDTEDPVFTANLTYDTVTETSVKLYATATDNVGVDHWEIRIDGNYHSSSSDTGSLDHLLTGLIPSTTYSIVVQPHDAAGNYANSTAASVTTLIQSVDMPILSGFNISNNSPSEVHFDASTSIIGMSKTGFIISGFTNAEISLTIDGDGLGGYFTVPTPFTFWDNNTIRLGENDDTVDSQPSILHNFTLREIINNINEPTSNYIRYVDGSVNSSGDGSLEAQAFKTIGEAVTYAVGKGGVTIYIKAFSGSYNENITGNFQGTPTSPTKFIGYKTTIEDLNNVDYIDFESSPTTTLTNIDAPVIDAVGGDHGIAMASWVQNIIIRNIQVQNSVIGLYANESANIIFDNCVSISSSNTNLSLAGATTNGRILNCTTANAVTTGVSLTLEYGLIKNNKVFTSSTGDKDQDYFISMTNGSNNIIKGNLSRAINGAGDIGGSHGCSVGGWLYTSAHNLVEDQISDVSGKGLEFRGGNSNYNVVRNIEIFGSLTAIEVRDGAYWNIVENSYIHNCDTGVQFEDGVEQGSGEGHDNLFKNVLITDMSNGFLRSGSVDPTQTPPQNTNNSFINCTFHTSALMFRGIRTNGTAPTWSNFNIKNCIIDGVTGTSVTDSEIKYNYNDFNNCGTWADSYIDSNNNVEIDPNFVNQVDFVPQATLNGTPIFGVEYDYDEVERDETNPTMGAKEI